MVNHSENSVSPETGDDTQRIESLRRSSQIEKKNVWYEWKIKRREMIFCGCNN